MLDVLPVVKFAVDRSAVPPRGELFEGRVLGGTDRRPDRSCPQSRTQLLSVSTAAFGSAEMPRFSGLSISMAARQKRLAALAHGDGGNRLLPVRRRWIGPLGGWSCRRGMVAPGAGKPQKAAAASARTNPAGCVPAQTTWRMVRHLWPCRGRSVRTESRQTRTGISEITFRTRTR